MKDVPDNGPPVTIPIDGTLDLHTFDPKDTGDLIPDYLRECRARGILEVRIIHGKGRGVLRERVMRLLERLPEVQGFTGAGPGAGDWGATLVTLHPLRE
jgi:DNA-nicking Smr family endonuclease